MNVNDDGYEYYSVAKLMMVDLDDNALAVELDRWEPMLATSKTAFLWFAQCAIIHGRTAAMRKLSDISSQVEWGFEVLEKSLNSSLVFLTLGKIAAVVFTERTDHKRSQLIIQEENFNLLGTLEIIVGLLERGAEVWNDGYGAMMSVAAIPEIVAVSPRLYELLTARLVSQELEGTS